MIFEVKEVLTKQTMSEDVNKKAKRNRHPDVVSSCYLKLDSLGRWITGYTPGYYDETVKDLIEEEREYLAQNANIKFDYNNIEDPFLSLFKVDRLLPGNKFPSYNADSPLGLFTIRAAIANGFIADKKENVGIGKFAFTTFYFESKENEVKKDKAIARLKLEVGKYLISNEDTRAWLIIQCFLHGMIVKETYSNETLYGFLADKLEAAKTSKDLEEMLKQFKRKAAEIESAFIAKQAIELKIVNWDALSLSYIYTNAALSDGSTMLGTNIKEVENYLNQKNKQEAYGHIRKDIYARYKIK